MVRLKVGRVLVAMLAMAIVAMPLAARADDDGDHDQDHDHDFARDLYEQGEIRALRDVLRALQQDVQGDVVAVELLQVSGTWTYRFQVIAPDGRRQTVDIDAGPVAPRVSRGDD